MNNSYAKAALKQWRELVMRAARGESIRPGELGQVAAVAGRSASQFDADVETVQKRDQAASDLEKLEAMDTTISEMRREAENAESEFQSWWKAKQEEAETRAAKVRELKESYRREESKRSQISRDAKNLLQGTADNELIHQKKELEVQARAEAEQVARQIKGTRQQREARKNLAAPRELQLRELNDRKLKPENFKLS